MQNKETHLANESVLLNILEVESLKMLERLKNNSLLDQVQFERTKEIIKRIYYNEKDYLEKEPDDYYDLYMEYYYDI
jgi:hypothetical protein